MREMASRDFADSRLTEHRNPRTGEIDAASSIEIVELLNAGGRDALIGSQEGAEDDVEAGSSAIDAHNVGPEALTGSTRLKAGTATKMILNTISTGAMIRVGKAYGNLMVDLTALSNKLIDRGERIVMEACGVDRSSARDAIEAADGSVKVAIVMIRRDTDATEARHLLDGSGGNVRVLVGDPPPMLA